MKLPDVRARLYAIADDLKRKGATVTADELWRLANETKRRSPIKRAPIRARRMTKELRDQIRAAAVANPRLSCRQIGAMFDVDGGRVSEALAGFRS